MKKNWNIPPQFFPGEPLIFLDIDGVLNKHNFDKLAGSNIIDQVLVQIFNRILIVTGCKIVLSSAWRYIYYRNEANLVGLDWLLRSHGMVGHRLIDVTGMDTMKPFYDGLTLKEWPIENERGKQIDLWLRLNDPSGLSPYVVIDDGGSKDGVWQDLGLTHHPVIWTDSSRGITYEHVERAIKGLQNDKV